MESTEEAHKFLDIHEFSKLSQDNQKTLKNQTIGKEIEVAINHKQLRKVQVWMDLLLNSTNTAEKI